MTITSETMMKLTDEGLTGLDPLDNLLKSKLDAYWKAYARKWWDAARLNAKAIAFILRAQGQQREAEGWDRLRIEAERELEKASEALGPPGSTYFHM